MLRGDGCANPSRPFPATKQTQTPSTYTLYIIIINLLTNNKMLYYKLFAHFQVRDNNNWLLCCCLSAKLQRRNSRYVKVCACYVIWQIFQHPSKLNHSLFLQIILHSSHLIQHANHYLITITYFPQPGP
jgi:hypothetical protein